MTQKSSVMECPECEHRVLAQVKEHRLSPTLFCGCGEAAVMQEVEQ